MDDQDPFAISALDVAASVGTVLLVGLAALALYAVGIVLVYVGFVSQPGATTTGVALALSIAGRRCASRDREEDAQVRIHRAQDKSRLRVRRPRCVDPVFPFRRAPDGVCRLDPLLAAARLVHTNSSSG